MYERALVEMAQWFARIQQYSVSHPACADLGRRAHAAFAAALEHSAPMVISVSSSALLLGDTPAMHPVLRNRFAPYLHERGVAVLRFASGVTQEELTQLLDLLTLPVQTTFDRGGLSELVKERGLARIEVVDLTHEVSAEERDAQRTRSRMRVAFGDLLQRLRAHRGVLGSGEHVKDLLDNPQVAVALLEENPLAVAEAVAGLCLLVREEQEKTGEDLGPKLRAILGTISAPLRARVLLGLAPLVGEFRESLVWGLDLLGEEELARFCLPAFRANVGDLEIVFYALALAVPHDGRRLSTLRFLALRLHDLPGDDAAAAELLAALAAPGEPTGSTWRERDVLRPHAARVLELRATSALAGEVTRESGRSREPFDAGRVMTELVRMASRTRRFGQVCATLPSVAARHAGDGATGAVLGIVLGLRDVTRAEHVELARRTLADVVSPPVAAQLLRELDAQSALAEGAALESISDGVKLVAELRPEVVLDRLELSESRKMRRILLDALAGAGTRIAPFVRAKLHAPSWFVVRNAVGLLTSCGGTAADFQSVARHPNEKVRAELLRALRAVPLDEGINAVLVELLVDPVLDHRARAVSLLKGELLVPRSIALVAAVVADGAQPEELRRRLVLALARSPHAEAAAALYEVLQPKGLLDGGELRDVAAEALRTSVSPAARALFEQGLVSAAWRVRRACEKAVEKYPNVRGEG